ncbi:MAG: cytochrome c [Thermoleophilia bacterium]
MRTRIAVAAVAVAIGVTGAGVGGGMTSSSRAPVINAKRLFLKGKPTTGAMACGSCHALKAVGTHGKVGPSLDTLAKDDDVAAIITMIVSPNAEIVKGYPANVMPKNYAKTLTKREIRTLATWISRHSRHTG